MGTWRSCQPLSLLKSLLWTYCVIDNVCSTWVLVCKDQRACQLCWALTFASSWFCSPKFFYKSLFTVHCRAEDLFSRPTDISLQFSSPELLWSLKRLEWGGGGWGTYNGKTWAPELDLGGLTAVFPSRYLCWNNNSYTRVAILILSTSFLHRRNCLAPPLCSGRGCQTLHSFPWKRVMWSKMANRTPTFWWHNSRQGHWLKQDHSDFSLGLACGFWERDALVLPDLLDQEEVSLSCG